MIPSLHHGAIGNGRVVALVAPTSAIEWSCLPRFDSPSIFARLLDAERGGTFRFLGFGQEIVGRASYIANTNVLRTTFEHEGHAWEVIDFAPRVPRGTHVFAPIEIVRMIRPLAGAPRISVDFDPRPDYARAKVTLHDGPDGIDVDGGPNGLRLWTNMPPTYVLQRREIVLRRPLFFILSLSRRRELPRESDVGQLCDDTIAGWRLWAKTCALPLYAAERVLRSALCLKLHAYEDTGAIVAAATTSIPEAMGSERTWDYRYCWLRDSAFVVEALRRLGHVEEGERFIHFLRDVAESGPLQPLYGIGGERELPETMLEHLAGFGGNGHVRIGNAAASQQQNDLMGELILCIKTLVTDPRIVLDDAVSYFSLVERLVEQAIAVAPNPDMGIWEYRTMMKPYTFSRAMCWAAIDRGARLARRIGRADLADRWGQIGAHEREEILRRAYNEKVGFFAQYLDGDEPDASMLLLPTLGLVDARDPRFLSTLEAYATRLVRGGLMLRYTSRDDFGETTSAFTMCSFWWAEALALAGHLDEAIAVFERVCRFSNPLGLFSEDVDPSTGMLLGNFPQAYTHVGLVHAAVTIGELLEARDGSVRAWGGR